MSGQLFCNIGKAIEYACDTYTFDVLLRMDADALIIGPRPQDDAIAYFKQHPSIGIAGGYEFNYHEERVYQGPRGWWPQNAWVAYEAFNPLSLLVPNWYGFFFRQIVMRAVKNGYVIGHQINGGAFFYQYKCAMAIRAAGWLNHPKLARLALAEDQIATILTRAVGMGIGNFSQDDAPFAVDWSGLPASPTELLGRKKKITHSVKKWQDMTQPQIRTFFAESRGQIFPHTQLTATAQSS